ncbi:MAG: bifunctional diaminohydroxyphosphoribosylaminopyrimidine deaminase/5-amino-6-(5-phosphoribosylamino)uracil reductase RibD [Candidatus Peribacteraceae bacterium]|nr:bifunctional diaminohydroxyphosphoribosylaminopyrimidine deaminase/5-amino-6-(5-phosphoribosylamino)uracil reductase RibD [Candidatus Peribacteraceae bacterium]MDD5739603.1 bifunctional diaminohydroxyphosphoribosylaminopyrimidine deaminase/5-amino-6-(5-phosphoribosylamino)uracil reductase RibD [Candidatus Peribacteraceae bacterium]
MHEEFIHRCLALAEQGRGKVGTNPLVGAVLVRGGTIIAEAFHEGFGKVHAERRLLENFDQKIRSEDVLYVNLEPCCHLGKTPACTDIIRDKGIKHIIFGMVDPDPHVSGKGIACLLKAGIRVTGPVSRAQCEWLNRGFVSLRTKGRPWVTIHSARTKNGAIARPDGSPLKITSGEQDRWTHAWLRGRHDAILVGVQTVIADDPKLTVRFGLELPSPLRVILDPHLRLPLTARVVIGESASGTVVITSSGSDAAKRQALQERGVRIAEIQLRDGRFDLSDLWKVLTAPTKDFHGIASVLIEGGAKTWQSFQEAGCIDEEVVLMGAKNE